MLTGSLWAAGTSPCLARCSYSYSRRQLVSWPVQLDLCSAAGCLPSHLPPYCACTRCNQIPDPAQPCQCTIHGAPPSSGIQSRSPELIGAPPPRCPGVGKWTEGDEASRHAFWLRTQRRRGALTRLGLQGQPLGEHESQPLTLPDQQLLKRLPADLRAQVQALQVGHRCCAVRGTI